MIKKTGPQPSVLKINEIINFRSSRCYVIQTSQTLLRHKFLATLLTRIFFLAEHNSG